MEIGMLGVEWQVRLEAMLEGKGKEPIGQEEKTDIVAMNFSAHPNGKLKARWPFRAVLS